MTLAGDTYQLTVKMSAPRVGIIENVLHFRQQTAPTDDVFLCSVDLLTKFNTIATTDLLLMYPQDIDVVAYTSRRVSDPGGPTATRIVNAAGTNATMHMGDSAMAVNVSLVPSEPPWQYGHQYIGPVPDDVLQTNGWSPTYITTVLTYIDLILGGLTTDAAHGTKWFPVIWQRKVKVARQIEGRNIPDKPTPLGRRLKPYA